MVPADMSVENMPLYRVYFVDNTGHVSGPPEVIDEDTNESACEKARQLVDGHDVELWLEDRLVMRFSHK
jgi:hypothetical protein